jgi:hypothetical protein
MERRSFVRMAAAAVRRNDRRPLACHMATPCMPSRDPRHDTLHNALRSRAFQRTKKAGAWWLVRVLGAELLRGCCAESGRRRVQRPSQGWPPGHVRDTKLMTVHPRPGPSGAKAQPTSRPQPTPGRAPMSRSRSSTAGASSRAARPTSRHGRTTSWPPPASSPTPGRVGAGRSRQPRVPHPVQLHRRRSLRAWLDSEERRRLLDRVAELLEADRGLQQLTGLDTWFKLVHIGGTWRVLFSITSRDHSAARLARPGTVPEGGTHYLVSSTKLGPYCMDGSEFLLGQPPERCYAGRLIRRESGVGRPLVGHDGHSSGSGDAARMRRCRPVQPVKVRDDPEEARNDGGQFIHPSEVDPCHWG